MMLKNFEPIEGLQISFDDEDRGRFFTARASHVMTPSDQLLFATTASINKGFDGVKWDALLAETIKSLTKLSDTKGAEYTQGRDDRLDNFRRNAEALGLQMEQVWAVYAGKHWDAIQNYVKDIGNGTAREYSESLGGRADDLIVYLILFKAMLIEKGR